MSSVVLSQENIKLILIVSTPGSAQQDQQAVVGNNEQAVTINIVSHSLIILSITFIISLSANTDAVVQIGLFSSGEML